MADMSNDSNSYASNVQSIFTGNCIISAAAALYCYEWLITLGQEFTHIWAQKWTVSTWIFAASRYATLLDVIVLLLPASDYISCTWIIRLDQAFTALQFLALALFTGLRAFSLCSRNNWILGIVLLLSLAPFVVNIMSFSKEPVIFTLDEPVNDCLTLPPFPENVSLRLSLGTRISIIAADVIVLIVTWRQTMGTVRQALWVGARVPLHEVLIRDGTVFFVALLVLNVFQILTDNIPLLFSLSPGTTFLPLLTSIIISRFMLNLKQIASSQGASVDTGDLSVIFFSSGTFVGNMGESLHFASNDEVDGQSM